MNNTMNEQAKDDVAPLTIRQQAELKTARYLMKRERTYEGFLLLEKLPAHAVQDELRAALIELMDPPAEDQISDGTRYNLVKLMDDESLFSYLERCFAAGQGHIACECWLYNSHRQYPAGILKRVADHLVASRYKHGDRRAIQLYRGLGGCEEQLKVLGDRAMADHAELAVKNIPERVTFDAAKEATGKTTIEEAKETNRILNDILLQRDRVSIACLAYIEAGEFEKVLELMSHEDMTEDGLRHMLASVKGNDAVLKKLEPCIEAFLSRGEKILHPAWVADFCRKGTAMAIAKEKAALVGDDERYHALFIYMKLGEYDRAQALAEELELYDTLEFRCAMDFLRADAPHLNQLLDERTEADPLSKEAIVLREALIWLEAGKKEADTPEMAEEREKFVSDRLKYATHVYDA